jgi:hypothetical protein
MKKIGQMYCGRSGNYLIYKPDICFSSFKYSVYHTADIFELSGLTRLKRFYFKKQALDYIEYKEHRFLNSEEHLQNQVQSGLMSESEMLEILEEKK